MTVDPAEPTATRLNTPLIAICGGGITLRSIGRDLVFRTPGGGRRSILIDLARKRFDTWQIEVGIQLGNFGLTLCLLCV
jgi:hypothetical protein